MDKKLLTTTIMAMTSLAAVARGGGSMPASPARGGMPASSYRGSMPASSYRGSMPASSYSGVMQASSYRGAMPASSYSGYMPASPARGAMPASSYSGYMPASPARGDMPASAARGPMVPSAPRGAMMPSAPRGPMMPSEPRGPMMPSYSGHRYPSCHGDWGMVPYGRRPEFWQPMPPHVVYAGGIQYPYYTADTTVQVITPTTVQTQPVYVYSQTTQNAGVGPTPAAAQFNAVSVKPVDTQVYTDTNGWTMVNGKVFVDSQGKVILPQKYQQFHVNNVKERE